MKFYLLHAMVKCSPNIVYAVNTLTQRAMGSACEAIIFRLQRTYNILCNINFCFSYEERNILIFIIYNY